MRRTVTSRKVAQDRRFERLFPRMFDDYGVAKSELDRSGASPTLVRVVASRRHVRFVRIAVFADEVSFHVAGRRIERRKSRSYFNSCCGMGLRKQRND